MKQIAQEEAQERAAKLIGKNPKQNISTST